MTAQLESSIQVPQIVAVQAVMMSGNWYTFASLQTACYATCGTYISENAISARIRDLRKTKYGSHTIERRATSRKGIFEYRLVPN